MLQRLSIDESDVFTDLGSGIGYLAANSVSAQVKDTCTVLSTTKLSTHPFSYKSNSQQSICRAQAKRSIFGQEAFCPSFRCQLLLGGEMHSTV